MSIKDKTPPLRLLKHFNRLSIKYNQEKLPLTNIHRIFSSYSMPSLQDESHIVPSFKRYPSGKYKWFTRNLFLFTSFHFQCIHTSFLKYPSDRNNTETPYLFYKKPQPELLNTTAGCFQVYSLSIPVCFAWIFHMYHFTTCTF